MVVSINKCSLGPYKKSLIQRGCGYESKVVRDTSLLAVMVVFFRLRFHIVLILDLAQGRNHTIVNGPGRGHVTDDRGQGHATDGQDRVTDDRGQDHVTDGPGRVTDDTGHVTDARGRVTAAPGHVTDGHGRGIAGHGRERRKTERNQGK